MTGTSAAPARKKRVRRVRTRVNESLFMNRTDNDRQKMNRTLFHQNIFSFLLNLSLPYGSFFNISPLLANPFHLPYISFPLCRACGSVRYVAAMGPEREEPRHDLPARRWHRIQAVRHNADEWNLIDREWTEQSRSEKEFIVLNLCIFLKLYFK